MKQEFPQLPNNTEKEGLKTKKDFIEKTKMKCRKVGNRFQCFLGKHDFMEVPGEHQTFHKSKDEEIKMKCQKVNCKAETTVRLHEGRPYF